MVQTMRRVLGSTNTTSPSPAASYPPPFNSNNNFHQTFNARVAITVAVVIAVFLFMSIFLFFLRNRWALEHRIISFTQQQQAAATELPNTHGLDIELVEKFPLMRYSSAKLAAINAGRLGSTDCSVCLTEFEDDEKLRILPNCGHGFHADCIDMWLLSHSTCPLCRISLVPSRPDQSTIMATDPPPQAQPEDHPPHIDADALSGDDPQSLSETRGSSRLVERLAVRALSRNSESFKKAAQDAELLSAGEVEKDGSTSSRRWKILRTACRSSEPHQQTSTSNAGEKDDPNLLSNMKTGKEVSTADDSMQQSGNYVFASDRWGSARSSLTSDEGYFSAVNSDSNLFTELPQQTERNELETS